MIAANQCRKLVARVLRHWPVRLLVMLSAVVLFDSTLIFVCKSVMIDSFTGSVREANWYSSYCEALRGIFASLFIMVFLSPWINKHAIAALLVLNVILYFIFLMSHIPGFYSLIWEFNSFFLVTPILIAANVPSYIEYRALGINIYQPAPLIFFMALLFRHLISVSFIVFLYDLLLSRRGAR